ncbi:MAG: DUF418 domain-containing protein, partial [Planctomycetota bacterium]
IANVIDQGGAAAPVVQAERIRSIDVLRGFALLGVLIMNMQVFAEVFAVYMHPFALGEISAIDYACWCVNRVLADGKFITIFSMLFGAGIVLMTGRAKARTGRSAGVHYRRMLWLALFGFAHALLLWFGDVLFTYAVCGLVAYLLRRFWIWVQFLLAVLLLLVPTVFLVFMHKMRPEDLQTMTEMWAPSAEYIESTQTAMRGSWLEQFAVRWAGWKDMLGFLFLFGWRLLGCMLLGMALFRKGVFSAERSRPFYLTLVVIGFAAGLPLAAWGIYDHEACGWEMVRSMGVGNLYNYFGSLIAAFGWIGLIMLMCRSGALPGLRHRLAAVGQMAFTNYIMHSVICTTIYNGHGLGLFGHVDRIWQQCLILAIFVLQLWYSPLWLKHFRFGPLEWLWRALTYWSLPPFRRAAV